MIDIHCHVLPGIDDGPPTLEEARALCRLAVAAGTTCLIATPHHNHPQFPDTELRRRQELRDRLVASLEEPPRIEIGVEVRWDRAMLDRLLDGEREGLSLAGSRYLLLEFDWQGQSFDIPEAVHELVVLGLQPVLAHPEHYLWLQDPALLGALAEAGAAFQLTAMSLDGRFGRATERRAWDLADRGLLDFVASDAHGADHRPPNLEPAAELLARRLGALESQRVLVDNPARVLEDRAMEVVR